MKQEERWPALPFAEWKDTYATLHMWTQMVGKVRLALSPNINHYWGTTLYVTARGLTTSAIPYDAGIFEVRFDFIAHRLEIATSLGETRAFRLAPRTVAEFYAEFMAALNRWGSTQTFGPCRWKCRGPCDSISMRATSRTTANTRTVSGGFSSSVDHYFSKVSLGGSSENAALCIFSGGASIWR